MKDDLLKVLLVKLKFDLEVQKAIFKAQTDFVLNTDVCVVQASITRATMTVIEIQIAELEKMLS